MNIWVSKNEGNFLKGCRSINISRSTLLHAVSQLLTAATSSLSTHNQMYYRIMNSSTNSTQCPLYCTLSVGTVKGCCTVHFVLCSVSSISSSNTVAVNSAAVWVNWRHLRFLCTVWRHSCVTLCCWWLHLHNCSWIFNRHYTYIRYKQCNCGCNQSYMKCNLLDQYWIFCRYLWLQWRDITENSYFSLEPHLRKKCKYGWDR